MARRNTQPAPLDGRPSPPDEVIRRADIAGTGKVPRQAADLARNYLYLHSKGTKAPKLEAQPIRGEKNISAWRIPLGADIAKGRPGRSMKRLTPDDLKAEIPAAPLSLDSHRPEWVSQSYCPRLAAPRQSHLLRRRNGRKVMPDFLS